MTQSSLYKDLEQLLTDVEGTTPKVAHEHVGGGEPGGQGATGGNTQSPTKGLENTLSPAAATDGSFGQTLSSEVKEQGPGAIDSLPDAKVIKPETIQGEVGLKQTTVGRDPSQEDNFGGTLKEPGVGTSTAAKFDDGRKYATVQEVMAKSAAARKAYLEPLANEILADIAQQVMPAAQAVPTPKAAAAPAAPAAQPENIVAEAQAGYELARVLGLEKLSHDERAQLTVADTIADALVDAELTFQHLKQAAEEGGGGEEPPPKKPEEEMPMDVGGGGGEGSAPPPSPAPSAGPPAGGGDPAAAGGGGGGDPFGSAVSQLASEGGQAGAPPAPGGGDAGLGPGSPQVSREELLQGLLMAMHEVGITPEEVMAAATQQGQPTVQKMAAAAKDFQRAGKFEFAPPSTKRAREICNRSKAMLTELFV